MGAMSQSRPTAMSQPLITAGFGWAQSAEDHTENSPEGYILEVDLVYTIELHDVHNAYQLVPELTLV